MSASFDFGDGNKDDNVYLRSRNNQERLRASVSLGACKWLTAANGDVQTDSGHPWCWPSTATATTGGHLEVHGEEPGEAAAAEEAHRREIERIRTEASAVERELKNAMEQVEKTRDAFKAEAVALNESIQAQASPQWWRRPKRAKEAEMLTNELSVMTSAARTASSRMRKSWS